MRRLLSLLLLLSVLTGVGAPLRAREHTAAGDTLRIMFWNLENFFDWHGAERHWTRKRFVSKCDKIAKAILWCADKKGGLPDAIGFAEVENRFVLNCLLRYTILDKLDYGIIHYDSPDRRGIDVALLYRKSSLKKVTARPVAVLDTLSRDTLKTRDILLADFVTQGGDSLTIAVNHHPSKLGGADGVWRREAAMRTLIESLPATGRARKVIVTGDFNDTPDNPVYARLEQEKGLKNLATKLSAQGKGTIRYNGKWELIDMFFVSGNTAAEMDIMQCPFLMVWDNVHAGYKPLRTYSGPRYMGGVSDHLPIFLVIH